MATSRKIVKVFLASPGDLQDERRAAKHVVDVFNKQWADNLGIHIELVGWEDTVSRFGRPQESINRDLDQCELFIGVMWKKWGTPPSDSGSYSSGFEEEFERSVESRRIAQAVNILYSERRSLTLSVQEKFGLIDAAFDNFSHHNMPLWHWLEDVQGTLGGDLTFSAMFGPPPRRIGALAAMRLVAEPINPRPTTDEVGIDRTAIVQSWFKEPSGPDLRIAALAYLAVCGTPVDLPVIRTELGRGSYQTIGAATDAIIRINLRQSREDALRAIYELQPESIDQALVDEVLRRPQSIDTALLLPGAIHRSPRVRKAVLPILLSRNALPPDVAERLLGDSDATVRYYALRSIVAAGKDVSEDRARATLIKPVTRSGLGIFTPLVSYREGEGEWKRFKRERLRTENIGALERLAAAETIFERDAHFALDYKQFSKRGAALREMVDDRFQTEFAKQMAGLEKRLGADSETVSKVKALGEHLRKEFLREGLDVLCEKASSEDLHRIREALKEGYVEYSELDINYLKRHGEWRDIELLVSLAERPVAGASLLTAASLLTTYNNDALDWIAQAAYTIGKGRFRELVTHAMPERLLSRILACASEKDFASLSDDEILNYLGATSEDSRKLAAMKSIRSLTKQRLKRIFDDYMNRDQRYYNVIHWLDMGISLPKARAITAAARVLSKLD